MEKNPLERQKEMWENIGVNIKTRQKMSQEDTCQVTSVTFLHRRI